jgi:hypothetical protein
VKCRQIELEDFLRCTRSMGKLRGDGVVYRVSAGEVKSSAAIADMPRRNAGNRTVEETWLLSS